MAEQLVEAGILLGVGMSVVFAFLTLLIAGIHAIAWFERAFPTPVATPKPKANRQSKASSNNNNNNNPTTVSPQIAAAISTAINTHRQTTSK